jgi:hypothetical protein
MEQSDGIKKRNNKKDKHPRKIKLPRIVGGWAFVMFVLFVLVGSAVLTWTALKYRSVEVFPPWISFLSQSLLSFVLISVVILQAYIYQQQREYMRRQVEIMGMSIEPRLRVTGVRAADFGVGGLPVFVVTLVNEGATEARNVEIRLELQKGDEPLIFWTRQQNVTIPANGKEEYPIRWPSFLWRDDIDGFNNNVPLRVQGFFIHQNTTVDFCYRYYPWPFGKRPDGLPQFFPCGFDPGLTVTMKAEAGGYAIVMGQAEAVRGSAVTEDNEGKDKEPS